MKQRDRFAIVGLFLALALVGVGLLYRCGFYTQEFNADGSTRIIYPQLDFTDLPIAETGKRITVKSSCG